MAIINRTPDSFHDRGATFALDAAVAAARRAIDEGATWVDIGGVPFSPDAERVGRAEEIERVRPLVAELAGIAGVTISVDTWRSEVAEAVLDAGASVINDTSGLADPHLARVVADADGGLIVAHSLAHPQTHLRQPRYADIAAEVRAFLADRCGRALAAGIDPAKLIIDPGPDLNKTTVQTLRLLGTTQWRDGLNYPWLAAVSNKDFIGETLDQPHERRLPGSLAAALWCLERGASLIRTHDIGPTVDALRMWQALGGTRAPAVERHNLS